MPYELGMSVLYVSIVQLHELTGMCIASQYSSLFGQHRSRHDQALSCLSMCTHMYIYSRHVLTTVSMRCLLCDLTS